LEFPLLRSSENFTLFANDDAKPKTRHRRRAIVIVSMRRVRRLLLAAGSRASDFLRAWMPAIHAGMTKAADETNRPGSINRNRLRRRLAQC
jgi:hypothetical protein